MNFQALIRALHEADVRFVIVGGMAAVVHGLPYATAVLDLCYARDAKNLDRLARVLAPFRPRLRDAPSDLPFQLDEATLRHGSAFTFTTTAGDLDLFGEIPGLGTFEQVQQAAVSISLFDADVLVLGLDGLIAAKEAAGRDKDLRLLPELRALRALRGDAM